MSSPAAPTVSFRTLLRRFGRNGRASAAVEFALVAPMFFALLFAILESALMFFATQLLETVTQDSARAISTGQAQLGLIADCQQSGQNAACDAAHFKTYVCNQSLFKVLFSCENLYVDVESYQSFSTVNLSSPIDANGNFTNNMQYSAGGPGDIVVVRLFYPWQLFVTGLGYNISNMSGNQRLLVATAAFQNEPY